MAQQLIEFHHHIPISHDLGYPVSDDLLKAVPPESVLVEATIRNSGRSPVTVGRCQWRTSQPGLIEIPNRTPRCSRNACSTHQ
jgi:hypothetical protein